jgi:Trk K+ transport system NAD-binding subunit
VRVVIVSAQRLGRVLALELLDAGHEVRLLEPSRDLLDALPAGFGGRVIHGSPLHRPTLEDAVAGCDALAAVSLDDSLNAVVALAARHEFHVPTAVAIVGNPRRADALTGRGANIVCPTTRTAREIRLTLDRSGVESELTVSEELALYRAEVPARLAGRTLAAIERPGELLPVALERDGRALIAAPDLTLAYGDILHLLARSREDIADMVRP